MAKEAKEAKEKFDFIQPIKDIPKTLKGFPKNIKSIIKDPVKNFDQIKERRRAIYPYIYLMGALLVVFLILGVAIQSIEGLMTTLAMVPGLCIVGCVFLLVVLKKAEQKFTDLECPSCKAQIEYSPNVQIKVLKKDFFVSKKKDYMSGVDRQHATRFSPMYCEVTGKETTHAEITCKCQKCGTEKTFSHSFVTVECNWHEKDIAAEQIDVVLMNMERAVREEGAEGFEDKGLGKTARGVNIKYNRSISTLVCGYFGNEIQMR